MASNSNPFDAYNGIVREIRGGDIRQIESNIEGILWFINLVVGFLSRHNLIYQCMCSRCRYGNAPVIMSVKEGYPCPFYGECVDGDACDRGFCKEHLPDDKNMTGCFEPYNDKPNNNIQY